MLKQQADEIIKEFIKPIYGFSLNKTGRIEEAEELASRILVKTYGALLAKSDIHDVKSYIWKLAQHVWADYIKEKKAQYRSIELDDLNIPPDNYSDFVSAFINSEDAKALRKEIAYLSSMQRQIVLMYYFEDMKLSDIAERLKLPLGTVKWHIFEAKKELKKGMDIMHKIGELGIKPIEFLYMGHNGYCGPKGDTSYYLERKITQNIAYAAYHQPMSINEIADELGISPLFVADEVGNLEEYGFMDKVGGDKYVTNINIIELNNERGEYSHKLYKEYAEKVAKLYCDQFFSMQKTFDDTGVYYPDRDYNFLLWSLIPFAISQKFYIRENDKVKFEEVTVQRKDGGNYIAHACLDSTDHLSYDRNLYGVCGDMTREISLFPIWAWQLNTYWSDRKIHFIYFTNEDLDNVGKFVNGYLPNNEGFINEYRFLVDKGYIIKDNGQYKLNLVWLPSSEATKKLKAALPDITGELKKLASEFDEENLKIAMQYMPKHLERLALYNNQNVMLNGHFKAYVLKNLIDAGKLIVPEGAKKKTSVTIMGIK